MQVPKNNIETREVDLRGRLGGVTIYFDIKVFGTPFLVFVKGLGTMTVYYHRKCDLSTLNHGKLAIPLPLHSEKVNVVLQGAAQLGNYMLGDLKKKASQSPLHRVKA